MHTENDEPEFDPVDDLLAEFDQRQRQERLTTEEFIARHPEHADQLRKYFADVGMAASALAPPVRVIRYLGDYDLDREIGRGGMGVVYYATQRSLKRPVALKLILASQQMDEQAVADFRREAELAARLQHPNIVRIHEVGEDQGQHFFSMDYVDGPNLADLARDPPLPPRQAAEYLMAVAKAVQYAHEQGVVHRDLKPKNILRGPDGQPRITDFGLARTWEAGRQLTETDRVAGSPPFMSPEQARGRASEIGPPCDIYALGATLYHLLASRPPFQADSRDATLMQVIHGEPVSPRLLNPAIDRDLETICLKCLEKEPSRRYHSAGDLADDLGRYLRREPILARPLGRTQRAVRWCRRNPLVASLSGILAFVFLAGFAGVTSMWLRAEWYRGRAEANYNRVFQAVDELYTDIGKDPTLEEPSLKPLRKKFYEGSQKQYEAFVAELGSDMRAENKLARAMLRLGEVYAGMGETDRGAESVHGAINLLERLVRENPDVLVLRDDLATAYEHVATAFGTLNPYAPSKTNDPLAVKQRKSWHSRALQVREDLMRREPANEAFRSGLVCSYVNMGQTLADGGEAVQGVEYLEKARQEQERLSESRRKSLACQSMMAQIFDDLAEASWRASRIPQAAALARKACDLREELLKADPTPARRKALAAGLENLAQRLFVAKEFQHIPGALQRSSTFYEAILAESVRETADVVRLRIEVARTYCEVNESLSPQANAAEPSVIQEQLAWLRKAQGVLEPVLAWTPRGKDEADLVAKAKEMLHGCQEDISELEGRRGRERSQ